MTNILNAVITDDSIIIPKSELISDKLTGGNLLLSILNTVYETPSHNWLIARNFTGSGVDKGRLTFTAVCEITLKPPVNIDQIINDNGSINDQLSNDNQLTNGDPANNDNFGQGTVTVIDNNTSGGTGNVNDLFGGGGGSFNFG